MVFTRLFSRPPEEASSLAEPMLFQEHWLPPGERLYAIGDIHGRLDCLNEMLALIAADEARRPPMPTTLVFLGDLIDRGLESRGVIDRVRALAARRSCVLLAGNHEEVLARAWHGDLRALGLFDRIGGRETLFSYGVDEDAYERAAPEERLAILHAHIPAEDIDFIGDFHDWCARGSYLFVHAGIRPGIAVESQASSDLRWIRREFLTDQSDHGMMVVHGHSIRTDVDEQVNRIGIDTGAYFTDRLTAVGLEGHDRWFLATGEAPLPIVVGGA